MNLRMRSHAIRVKLAAAVVLISAGVLVAESPPEMSPQPTPSFSRAPAGTWGYGWQGVPGRTYLMEWSTNLSDWHSLPLTEAGAGAKSYGGTSSTSKLFLRLNYSDEIPDLGKGGDWSPPLLRLAGPWKVVTKAVSGQAAAGVRLSFYRWPASATAPSTTPLMTAFTATDGSYEFNPSPLSMGDRVEVRITGSPNQRVYLPWRTGSLASDASANSGVGGNGLTTSDIPASNTPTFPGDADPPSDSGPGEVFRLMDFLTIKSSELDEPLFDSHYHPAVDPKLDNNGNPELDENQNPKSQRVGVVVTSSGQENRESTKTSTQLWDGDFDNAGTKFWDPPATSISGFSFALELTADFGAPGSVRFGGTLIRDAYSAYSGGGYHLPLQAEGSAPRPIVLGNGVTTILDQMAIPYVGPPGSYYRHLVLSPVPAHVPISVMQGGTFYFKPPSEGDPNAEEPDNTEIHYFAELPLLSPQLKSSKVEVADTNPSQWPVEETKLRWTATVTHGATSTHPVSFNLIDKAEGSHANGKMVEVLDKAAMIHVDFNNESTLPDQFGIKLACEFGIPNKSPASAEADYDWTSLGEITQEFEAASSSPTSRANRQAAEVRGHGNTPESAHFNGGQRYKTSEAERRIGVTGLPAPDSPTFVDALTGRFHHSERDFSLAVPGSDLSLTVSRSLTDTIWTQASGLRPQENPVLAFGPGWDSNLSAVLIRTRKLNPDSSEASPTGPTPRQLKSNLTVRDYQGRGFSFIEYTNGSNVTSFIPDPTMLPDRDSAGITLTKDSSGNFILSQPLLGLTHVYQTTTNAFKVPNNRDGAMISGSQSTGYSASEYYRLASVTDRFGVTLNYNYNGKAANLIPDEISVAGRSSMQLRLQQDGGRVQAFWDPSGIKHSYIYQTENFTPPGQSAIPLSVLTTHKTGPLTTASYGYHFTTEADPRPTSMLVPLTGSTSTFYTIDTYHLIPGSMANGVGDTITLHYQPSLVRQAWSNSANAYYYPAGDPLLIQSITLPNERTVSFDLQHSLKYGRTARPTIGTLPGQGAIPSNLSITTNVTDQAGNHWTYAYSTPAERHWQLPAADAAFLPVASALVFTSLTRTCTEVPDSAMTFTYDPAAGYALSEAKDAANRSTKISYGETFTRPSGCPYTAPLVAATTRLHDRFQLPSTTTDVLGHVTTYHYISNPGNPDDHLADTITDHRGRVIHLSRGDHARTQSIELRSADDEVLSKIDLDYSVAALPGVVTRTTRRATGLLHANDPAWVSDLVTTTEPDANGFTLRTGLDANGNGSLEDSGDIATTFTRSASGRILSVTGPNGGTRSNVYNASGQLETVSMEDGSGKTYQRDAAGRVVLSVDTLGQATGTGYDAMGRVVTAVRDMDGNLAYASGTGLTGINPAIDTVASASYLDASGEKRLTDPRGYMTVEKTDALGRTTHLIQPSQTMAPGAVPTLSTGNVTVLEYDLLQSPSKPVKVTDPLGYETIFKFDAFARLETTLRHYATDSSSAKLYSGVRYGFDSNGLPETVTLTRTPLDEDGEPLASPRQDLVSKITYDLLDRPETSTRALGTDHEVLSHAAYTSTGIPWQTATRVALATGSTGEKWSVSELTCDAFGRPVKRSQSAVTDALTGSIATPFTDFLYNAHGQIGEIKDAYGHSTTFGYDVRGRMIWKKAPEVTDARSSLPQTPTTIFSYDAAGNINRRIDPLGYAWAYEHDAAGQIRKAIGPVIRPDATDPAKRRPVWERHYDPAGNLISDIDPEGHVTTNTFYPDSSQASSSMPVHLTAANGSSSLVTVLHQFGRDAMGRLTRLTDGAGQATAFTYDGLGRSLTTTRDPDDTTRARTDTTTYDALLPTAFTNAKGQHRDYHYNDAFLLDELQVIDPTTNAPGAESLVYLYDLTGRLTGILPTAARLAAAATRGDPTVARSYDLLGRLESETSNGLTTTYGYDLLDQLTTVATPGRTVTMQHDAAGRTWCITDASGATLQTTFGHDLAGRVVTETLANGLKQSRAYDPIGRQLRQILSAENGTEISRTETQYDLLSNVTRLQEFYANPTLPDRLIENTYDERSQLVSETQTIGSSGSPATTKHRYDAAENLLSSVSSALTRNFSYDDSTNGLNSNQLYQLSETQGGSTTATTFAYDDNGNRVSKSVGSTVTDSYTYDSFNRLTQLALSGGSTFHYDYDPLTRRIARWEGTGTTHHFAFSGSSPSLEWDGVRNNGSLLSHIGGGVGGRLYTEDSSGQTSSGIYNSRGDLTAQVSTFGNLTWSGQYSASGLLQSQTGTKTGNYGANGKWEEPGSLVNDGFRYRDRSTGTFLTLDPAGFIDGPNRYNYVHHNPWSAFDPDGLTTIIPNSTKDIGYNDNLSVSGDLGVNPPTNVSPFGGVESPDILDSFDDEGEVSSVDPGWKPFDFVPFRLKEGINPLLLNDPTYDGHWYLNDGTEVDEWGRIVLGSHNFNLFFSVFGRTVTSKEIWKYHLKESAKDPAAWMSGAGLGGISRGLKGAGRVAEQELIAGSKSAKIIKEAGKESEKVIPAAKTPPHFSGTDKPWTKGATPDSTYTHIDPKTGKAVQNAIYDGNGDVVGHVDFKNHDPTGGRAPSGHGHTFPQPGNPASGHGPGKPHIPNNQLPAGWDTLPPGVQSHTPLGQ